MKFVQNCPRRFSVNFRFSEDIQRSHKEFSEKFLFTNFAKNTLPAFHRSQNFSENFDTILVNLCFRFWSTPESRGQAGPIQHDDAILPDH